MNAPNNHCIRKCQKGVLQKYLELCYSTILKVELYCSTILKLIIFVYSPFSDSLSLSVSLLIPLSTTMSLSHGGLFWRGLWVRCGGETGEVEIGVVWWRFLGFLGLDRRGMIGNVFKLSCDWHGMIGGVV